MAQRIEVGRLQVPDQGNDIISEVSELERSEVSDQTEQLKVDDLKDSDAVGRMPRLFFIVFAPCLALVIKTYNTDVELSVLIAVYLECMFFSYFLCVGYFFWTGTTGDRYLFRVKTKSSKFKGWAKISVAEKQIKKKYQSIDSISEFSAVEGGIPCFMLANLGPMVWMVLFMHFASELHCDCDRFQWDITDILEIIGCGGLVMISVFQLDPYDEWMGHLHNVGAVFGCGTVVGSVIQGYFLMKKTATKRPFIVSAALASVAVVSFCVWTCRTHLASKLAKTVKEEREEAKKEKKKWELKEEHRKQINRNSLYNVISEGIFLFSGASSMCLWLARYSQNCTMGCAGPIDSYEC